MKPSELRDLPSWEWPEDAGRTLLPFLKDNTLDGAERLAACEVSGDLVVVNDEIARVLLSIAGDDEENVENRCAAAISLGPALEEGDLELLGPDELEELDELEGLDGVETAVSPPLLAEIRKRLHRLFFDGSVPKDVRRAVLEASVRAAEPWHDGAVRQALDSDDRDWRLTGVFGTRHVRGFDDDILKALDSDDEEIEYEAVLAAGNWGLRKAWPHVSAILTGGSDRPLLLAAIEAAPFIDPDRASVLLAELADSGGWADDEEIQDSLEEALAMCEGQFELEDDPDEDEDDLPY